MSLKGEWEVASGEWRVGGGSHYNEPLLLTRKSFELGVSV